MKDISKTNVILGMKISRTSDGILLSQTHYVDKIIERFKTHNIKETSNPFLPHIVFHKNSGNGKQQLEYYQIIGSVMYLMNCTRPDITYSVSKLSRYTSNPSNQHCDALLRVLRYLKRTREYSLCYKKYPLVIEGYNDANWISDTDESKSTSGYVFTLGGGAISWKSSKQTCIARSTMESSLLL